MTQAEAVQMCRKALGKTNDEKALNENSLEVSVLDRRREGRKYQRIRTEEIRQLLGSAGSG